MYAYYHMLFRILYTIWKCFDISSIINISSIKDISSIILNIITGVSIIKGIGYLKGLKEKTNNATFSFLIQLRVRIWELYSWLSDDPSLIDNMYEPIARRSFGSDLSAKSKRISIFKKKIQETLNYIQSTPDQMPAYKGWTKDYNIIVSFLNDAIQFDISNGNEYFKYKGQVYKSERDSNCKIVCDAMKRLCNKIEERQLEIENIIF